MLNLKANWAKPQHQRTFAVVMTVLLGWLFLVFPIGEGLRNLSYELPYLFHKPRPVEEAVILYMDDESHAALGQSWERPWDRALHARLLERLTALKTEAVVLDILFDVPSSPAGDQQLVHSALQHGKVVVATKVVPQIMDGNVIGMKLLPIFTNVFHWGAAESSEEDKTIRQHYRDKICLAPSVAWTAAELTMTNPPSDPTLDRWVNYYGPPGTIPFFSYYQVFSNTVPPGALSNKVVFVGARYSVGMTGGLGTDDFRTPYTRWTGTKSPGVEITATTYLNLRRGDWLRRVSPWRELLLLLILGGLLGFGLSSLRPLRAAGLGALVAAGLFPAASGLVWTSHLWFAWAIVSVVQVPVAVGCALLFSSQGAYLERQKLEEVLAAGAALAKAEGYAMLSPVPTPGGTAGTATSVLREQMRALRKAQGATPSPFEPVSPTVRMSPPPIPDYTLLRHIGAGAYGEVWLAQSVVGAFHSVKIVHRNSFQEDRPYEREFEGIKHFDPISRSHPGLVHILHVGRNQEAGYYYYVMELADDLTSGTKIKPPTYEPKTLGKIIVRHGKLSLKECIEIGLRLTEALAYLHDQGLIHRDIKPSNIIFVSSQPKLADIGLVTGIGDSKTFVGTEGFYPPEGPGTPAADIFSLGKVLYEAATGFSRQRFPELPTDCDRPAKGQLFQTLNRIILRACERDVAQRYASAKAMHEDLARLR
jgi:CHASE2 domain-containing sensor protein